MNRPLVWIALGFTAGLALAANAPAHTWLHVLLLFAALAIVPLLPPLVPRDAVALLLVFAMAGVLAWQLRMGGPPGDPLFRQVHAHPGERLHLEGVVRSAPIALPGDEYARVLVDVDRVANAEGLRGGVLVRWTRPESPVYPGERVAFDGVPEINIGHVNFGVHGAEDTLRNRGIHTRVDLFGGELRVIETPRFSLRYWIAHLRERIAQGFAASVPPSALPFVLTIWLGDNVHFSGKLFDRYVDTGTAHVLAVSGAHVSILYVGLRYAARALFRRRMLREGACLAVIWLFSLLSGGGVSALRAAFMMSVYLSAGMMRREKDIATALAISALCFLAWSPAVLFDVGFQLSYASIASILLFNEPTELRILRLPRAFTATFTTTVSVQALTLPLSLYYFHVLPLLLIPANVLVVPLAAMAIMLCLLATPVLLAAPAAAPVFGYAIGTVANLAQWIVDEFARVPGAKTIVSSPSIPAIALWWLAALCAAHAVHSARRPAHWCGAAAVAMLCAIVFWKPLPPPPGIDFLDVGHGDAALLRTPGGKTMLIDAGDRSEYTDYGRQVVAPFLLSNGIATLDYLLITHPDRDHIGGSTTVLNWVGVKELVLWPNPSGAMYEEELLAAAKQRGIPVTRVAAGEHRDLGGAAAEILHPPAQGWDHAKPNDRSITMRVSWPGMSVLFTGDIEAGAERAVAAQDCRAQLLKSPHHGSRTSSSPALLEAVAPQAVVVSTRAVGKRPPIYTEVEQRYRDAGITIWRTDLQGGIRARVENEYIVLEGARDVLLH